VRKKHGWIRIWTVGRDTMCVSVRKLMFLIVYIHRWKIDVTIWLPKSFHAWYVGKKFIFDGYDREEVR